MSDRDRLLTGTIPIVGVPLEVFQGAATVTGRCKCSPENTPFLLTDVSQAAVCHRCGNMYGIVQVVFDRAKGHSAVDVHVALIGKREPRPRV